MRLTQLKRLIVRRRSRSILITECFAHRLTTTAAATKVRKSSATRSGSDARRVTARTHIPGSSNAKLMRYENEMTENPYNRNVRIVAPKLTPTKLGLLNANMMIAEA